MRKVLCFGDSNTFGFNPMNGLRYPKEIRWTAVLQELCGNCFEIIEAGCNNRTCFRNNPEGKKYTGSQILPEYLNQNPDIVILALGANDLQRQYRTSLVELKYGMESLVSMVKSKLPNADIIIVSPSVIGEKVLSSRIFSFLFDETSIEKSKQLAQIYEEVASLQGCRFVDWNSFAPVSELDGLHYSEQTHRLIAEKFFELIASLNQ